MQAILNLGTNTASPAVNDPTDINTNPTARRPTPSSMQGVLNHGHNTAYPVGRKLTDHSNNPTDH
jgi:hypothetical protein